MSSLFDEVEMNLLSFLGLVDEEIDEIEVLHTEELGRIELEEVVDAKVLGRTELEELENPPPALGTLKVLGTSTSNSLENTAWQ
uniref:Uncharacterized protein n=1 Tax=Glossina palpalis gambiensis TaxID=67801 RepID=A0A1B0BV82_9MUSC